MTTKIYPLVFQLKNNDTQLLSFRKRSDVQLATEIIIYRGIGRYFKQIGCNDLSGLNLIIFDTFDEFETKILKQINKK